MHSRTPNLQVFLISATLLMLWATTVGLTAKLFADGYQSHAVGVQLKIARYEWFSGDVRRAAELLWRTAPQALEAGWRWQMAEGLFVLARGHAWLGDVQRATQLCQAGLAALGYGRYAQTRNGTSTTYRRCDEFSPPP